jgi:hypothetical protein
MNSERNNKEKEMKKEYITLCNISWIDIFSNEQIWRMFASVNNNPSLYWLEKQIDIANLSLWFDTALWGEELNDHKKQWFFELCNRTYSGSPNFPISYENWNVIYYANEEDAINKIQAPATFNLREFVKISLWTDPTMTAQRNLEESMKNYWPIWSKKKKEEE